MIPADIFVVIVFIYIIYPLFLLFMSSKVGVINIYRLANWQHKAIWGRSIPTQFYENKKIRDGRKKLGLKFFYISLISGVFVVLELLIFPKDSVLYFLGIFHLIITSFMEAGGGFIYGMAKRDEILEKYLCKNNNVEYVWRRR